MLFDDAQPAPEDPPSYIDAHTHSWLEGDGVIRIRNIFPDKDSLKNLRPIANAINERHWYDNDGNYHYEGVCKTSNVRSIISETPRVFDKAQ